MKLQVYTDSPVRLSKPMRYLYLVVAVGMIQVTWEEGGRRNTEVLRPGAQLKHRMMENVELTAVTQDQEIEIDTGMVDDYMPPITARTSTLIERINQPVSVTGSTVEIAGKADVSGSVVDVSGSTVTATVNGAVEVIGNRSASVASSEITIPASGSASIAARTNRSRIILQNDSVTLTKCRVTEAGAVAATGLRLIGGDGMLGEQILQTTAELKVWNTSDTEATVSIFEEVG